MGFFPIKEAGQYRLIHHLSYPQNFSINDFIPEESKRVSYATIDNAVDLIVTLGPNCKLAKTNIDSAYRNVPIHPNDHELLGISWAGQYYFDRCLPMGCAYLNGKLKKKHTSVALSNCRTIGLSDYSYAPVSWMNLVILVTDSTCC